MRFFPLLLTVFIDALGFGLVFPVLSPLIMDPLTGILPFETTISMRGLLFGILASAFCVGPFFSGPILGAISDRKGRKKILLFTVWMSLLSYSLAAVSILTGSIALLLISRLLNGIAAGNYSLAQSMIVDLSSDEDKAKNFGLLGMAWGAGFIVGPYFGGKLSLLSLTAPFLFAAAMCLVNAVALIWKVKETLPTAQLSQVPWTAGISHLKTAFSHPILRNLFIVMFIMCLGWGFFTELCPIFLVRSLNFDLSQIANFYAYVGLCVAVAQGFLIRPFLTRFSTETLLTASLIGLGFALPLMLLAKGPASMLWIMPLIAFTEAFIFPTSSTLISNLTPKHAQGEILGINNSIQWAAIGITPMLFGSFTAVYPFLPIAIASLSMFLAAGLFLLSKKAPQSA